LMDFWFWGEGGDRAPVVRHGAGAGMGANSASGGVGREPVARHGEGSGMGASGVVGGAIRSEEVVVIAAFVADAWKHRSAHLLACSALNGRGTDGGNSEV
jgi:hypothetical protein